MSAGAWQDLGRMPHARSHFGAAGNAAVWEDGRVLVPGGADGRLTACAETVLFDPVSGSWSPTGLLGEGRRLHSVTLLRGGRVLVAGGVSGALSHPSRPLATAEVYDPETGAWTRTGSMGEARYGHSADLLPDGRVLVAGGGGPRSPDSDRSLRSAEIYDPGAGTWTPAEPMTDARCHHPTVPLPDGRILAVGGYVATRGSRGVDLWVSFGVGLAHCEAYDPGSGTWQPTADLTVPRHGHQATLLPDGTVLATGGGSVDAVLGGGYRPHSLAGTERYDPDADHWRRDVDMPVGRSRHRAVPLASGRLLVMGGADDTSLDAGHRTAAVYDPATGTWTPTPGLRVGRRDFVAAALPDGRVLAAAGIVRSVPATTDADEPTATTEVFVP